MKSSYKARYSVDRKRKAKHSRRLARQQRAAERWAEWAELSDEQKKARSDANRAAYQASKK